MAETQRTYPVRDNLDYDGDRYGDGDTVAMPPDQAAPLIALGVLGEPQAAAPEPAKAAPKRRTGKKTAAKKGAG